jgi:Uma2 family endonuclease
MTRKLEPTFLPAGALPLPRMTYRQFLQHPWENTHVEWVDGVSVMMAPIGDAHNVLTIYLICVLNLYVAKHDLGTIRTDPFQMKTGPKLPGRAPDILFVAKKNLHRLRKTSVAGPADLVVEVISPGSRGVDRGDKLYEYEKGGVPEYWLLDPERKKAEFYLRGRDGSYEPAELDRGVFRSAVIKGLWLRVEWLWQRTEPPTLAALKELGLP